MDRCMDGAQDVFLMLLALLDAFLKKFFRKTELRTVTDSFLMYSLFYGQVICDPNLNSNAFKLDKWK